MSDERSERKDAHRAALTLPKQSRVKPHQYAVELGLLPAFFPVAIVDARVITAKITVPVPCRTPR